MAEDVFATDPSGTKESVLDTLVGEGKKFESAEALAAGKLAADNHISTIEQENAALKEQLVRSTAEDQKAAQVKELLDAVKAGAAKPNEGSEGDKTMSQEELTEIVKNALQDEKSAETKAANRARGNALVLEKMEGNVEAARVLVAERAKALGMSVDALAELSESSPDAFATLVRGTDESTANSNGSLSVIPNHNTDVLNNQPATLEVDGFKTKAWFDAQRKEMGVNKYLNDQVVQGELIKSINGLGERFNN